MAAFVVAGRLSARLTARQLRQDVVASRGFGTSTASLAAHNFTMPALSPTMTEGNIAQWKVKEGDSFSAGDVLLEIETDKASMDVEAQDDGIVAKIIQGDGSKGVRVGSRIGVLAESGDDLSTLEMPADESSTNPSPKQDAPKSAPMEPVSEPNVSQKSDSLSAPPKRSSGTAKKQTYPLLPSVHYLIKEHKLDPAEVEKMTPTGPNNRLLKGDVLAYVGSISSSSPAKVQSNFERLAHLDLSNIKVAAPKAAPKAKPEAPLESVAETVEDIEVMVQVSLKAASEVQKRIESTLGISVPLSTFISRASDYANDNLPRPKSYQPTSDELFNQVLGLPAADSSFRGHFLPEIRFLQGKPSNQKSTKQPDIYDLLSGTGRSPSVGFRAANPTPVLPPLENTFSVRVPFEDKKQAEVFLYRVKAVLEDNPGELIL